MSARRPVMLLILDGFGIAPAGPGNAIEAAKMPNIRKLRSEWPHAELQASGRAVGLPEGQMGNSEVGHTNIGAGRVVWQELSRISNAVDDGSFFKNEELVKAMDNAADGHALHLMGLLSDGGVHSHNEHLYALIKMAAERGLKEVYVHCILDGRDVPPACAEKYIAELQEKFKEYGTGEIATIAGRFYTMDRDKRWDRVEASYDLYTLGEGYKEATPEALMERARKDGENDEFVKPGIVAECGTCEGGREDSCSIHRHTVHDGDSIIFFNFRPDRAREITRCFVDPDFDGFARKVVLKDLCYVCFTTYDATIPNVSIAFKPQTLHNTMGEYISGLGLKQLRIAETEKYAHVTFFFNGGVEQPYEGEERILVPSPKVATYDLKPEMSAYEVTEKAVERIASGELDLIIMNLANCDMVGHTGVFDAAVAAVEAVDECVGKIAKAIKKADGILIITADHGNADEMLDAEGNIVTAHSTNPVPVILFNGPTNADGSLVGLMDGALCDLAPTLLRLMQLDVPEDMEGRSLLTYSR